MNDAAGSGVDIPAGMHQGIRPLIPGVSDWRQFVFKHHCVCGNVCSKARNL